jgi:acyl-coenzyme A thioesterase PaaI-like protein
VNEGTAKQSEFDVPRFCARFLAQDHNALMGLRYVSHAADRLELELPYNPAFGDTSRHGGMADGAIMTLLDMAGTISVWGRLDRFRPHATIDFRIDHLRAPPATSLRCEVSCFHIDDELARVHGSAFAGTEPIATFAATYAFTDVRV